MRSFLSAVLFESRFRRQRYWSAIGLYILILILGAIPGARADMGKYASGLTLHSCAYALLTFLLFSGSIGAPLARAIKATLTVMLLGAIDELFQTFFPYRHGSVQDWIVDCSAATVTAFLLWIFWTRIDCATQP
jgi:hypothetical protein